MEVRNGMRRLTGRERQVLAHALDGLQNPAIAAALHLSERTVEAHRSRLLLKLDAPSLQAWLQRYEKAGLVRPVLLAELTR
jgi:DNA-binding NarL/FixJ family response regulator